MPDVSTWLKSASKADVLERAFASLEEAERLSSGKLFEDAAVVVESLGLKDYRNTDGATRLSLVIEHLGLSGVVDDDDGSVALTICGAGICWSQHPVCVNEAELTALENRWARKQLGLSNDYSDEGDTESDDWHNVWYEELCRGAGTDGELSEVARRVIQEIASLEGEDLKAAARAIATKAKSEGIALDDFDQASFAGAASQEDVRADKVRTTQREEHTRLRDPQAIECGKEIRRLRKLRGHAVAADFAKLIGKSRGQLSDWETGFRLPSLQTMETIAIALDLPRGLLTKFLPQDPENQ